MVATPAKVFISYRRSDSQGATGRLYDRLNAAYPGMFFRDVSGIAVGVDFTKEIERAVSSSVALIAVIGPEWITESVNGKQRLDDPADFVRLEISSALTRHIRIIPVLVGGASMPSETDLPPDLRGFRKWNAIQLVEEYYEEGIERLIDALRSDLGEPRASERAGADEAETSRRLRELRGEAEAALAVEDWFAAIQALQAAVSLDPGSAELSARLRFAHERQKVRSRRSSVRRWTAGAVAAVCATVVVAGALVVWAISSEFSDAASDENAAAALLNLAQAATAGQTASPQAVAASEQRPAAERPRQLAPAQPVSSGPGFPARGRWRMTARENQATSILLDLGNDGSFAVTMPSGFMDVPLSGGRFNYNDATGMLQITGVNNLNAFFSEIIHVFEREDDHFHANYLGAIWELTAE